MRLTKKWADEFRRAGKNYEKPVFKAKARIIITVLS
jgi:hypothetical protein